MSRDDKQRETLEEYVRRVVDAAPPLTEEQGRRLANLLGPIALEPENGP